ncbi:MAG: hypothetical protein A2233_04990 [Candidatus Kerfeldbacteria bacterium RIFOXYA2_FULL_38_24]|uniref:Uncharacterized protein n=1 Tax=Candidatus Kerfeldbacteria bacterium RIFOXYB2_FULL_38_14 TaxID=1798547 RepID=A0A1G2B946_9BACT|nr:MAG: hypothetical protein A2233_04990 [Candidatus Kerfeldbacteria bacterium RIFOXYA2_FULL_38_24]OGY85681.1 MAG: hypothetical protein A2319_05260 [Candidatus Kerfeldbacteria bacterium RIFOXYB2_FULL_38_14]OGY88367.1 MAG: hypothetical protein A2458_02795 [Candidatus Kerfeldbacteria bacterium RIFOXYC2_FULL_38_9]
MKLSSLKIPKLSYLLVLFFFFFPWVTTAQPNIKADLKNNNNINIQLPNKNINTPVLNTEKNKPTPVDAIMRLQNAVQTIVGKFIGQEKNVRENSTLSDNSKSILLSTLGEMRTIMQAQITNIKNSKSTDELKNNGSQLTQVLQSRLPRLTQQKNTLQSALNGKKDQTSAKNQQIIGVLKQAATSLQQQNKDTANIDQAIAELENDMQSLAQADNSTARTEKLAVVKNEIQNINAQINTLNQK